MGGGTYAFLTTATEEEFLLAALVELSYVWLVVDMFDDFDWFAGVAVREEVFVESIVAEEVELLYYKVLLA